MVFGPAATGVWRCAATRRPPPRSSARARARPCRCRRGTSLLEQAPLPGPPTGRCAACAPAPARVLGLCEGGRGCPGGPSFSAELLLSFYGEDLQALARSDVEARFKAIVETPGRALPAGRGRPPSRGLLSSWLASVLQALGKSSLSAARACLLARRLCDAWVVPTGCVHSELPALRALFHAAPPATPTACYSISWRCAPESSASQTRATPSRFWYPSARSKALRDTKPWFT